MYDNGARGAQQMWGSPSGSSRSPGLGAPPFHGREWSHSDAAQEQRHTGNRPRLEQCHLPGAGGREAGIGPLRRGAAEKSGGLGLDGRVPGSGFGVRGSRWSVAPLLSGGRMRRIRRLSGRTRRATWRCGWMIRSREKRHCSSAVAHGQCHPPLINVAAYLPEMARGRFTPRGNRTARINRRSLHSLRDRYPPGRTGCPCI